MRRFKLDKDVVITKDLIQNLIEEHSQERRRILEMKLITMVRIKL